VRRSGFRLQLAERFSGRGMRLRFAANSAIGERQPFFSQSQQASLVARCASAVGKVHDFSGVVPIFGWFAYWVSPNARSKRTPPLRHAESMAEFRTTMQSIPRLTRKFVQHANADAPK
jgi:hypothetical protein